MLTKKEFHELADEAIAWKAQELVVKAKLKACNEAMKKYAKHHRIEKVERPKGKVGFSDNTTSSANTAQVITRLEAIGLEHLMPEVLGVKVGELRKAVGELHTKDLIYSVTKEFDKVTIKPNKK